MRNGGGGGSGGGADSPDSFLELLIAETSGVILDPGSGDGDEGGNDSADHHHHHDQETQDILQWLDDNDQEDAERRTVELVFSSKLTRPLFDTAAAATATLPPEPTLVSLPPSFATLEEALASKESAVSQIRTLFVREQSKSDERILVGTQRAELYCRMVCHKSLAETMGSSLADSFEQWKTTRSQLFEEDSYATWIRQLQLSQRIAQQTGRTLVECETDLIDLVLYHHHHQTTLASPTAITEHGSEPTSSTAMTTKSHDEERDILLPAVATVILTAGIPVSVAAVMLSQIIPNVMPLLALPPETERWDAAISLHSCFYRLACYHVPLLVFHLDRYLPGWYWPKLPDQTRTEVSAVALGRNLKKHGQLPPSWLLSHVAGECCGAGTVDNTGTMLPASTILLLWDGILTGEDNATRFFLALAVLERQAETLLLLTGEDLAAALRNVWTLKDIDKNREPDEKDWLHEWWPQVLCLEAATPVTVLDQLKKAEDEAVQHALLRRQERAEAALKARLEAEAAAYRQAQELKAEEARQRLSRARLVAFYRKHAPDKESNIDKIMETFAGRLDVLDAKLKSKYGEGFNPALKVKPTVKAQNKLLATMNQGFARIKSDTTGESEDETVLDERKPDSVSVMVSAEEVLPVVCWSKKATAARGVEQRRRRSHDMNRKPLKFYLVDSRSEEAAQEQGRFPTAVILSPEAMLDPERLQQNEEMFESLRGAVHIVIMGEGFKALPNLYNQKLSPKLGELMEQDESRTNLCALFFQKRGFCFVSMLDGGFCAAHSWLVREGPKHHLNASAVLVDYDPEANLFGQLETLHNASAAEKAQRKMANLLEASIVTMTKRAYQLERLTSDFETKDGRQGLGRISLFTRSASTGIDGKDGSKPSGDDAAVKQGDESASTAENADNSPPPASIAMVASASTEATPPASPSKEKAPLAPESADAASSSTTAPSNPLGKLLQGGATKPTEDIANFLGAAFSSTRARFGGADNAPPESAPAVGGGGFGRFSQFRKTMMRASTTGTTKDEPNPEVSVPGSDADAGSSSSSK